MAINNLIWALGAHPQRTDQKAILIYAAVLRITLSNITKIEATICCMLWNEYLSREENTHVRNLLEQNTTFNMMRELQRGLSEPGTAPTVQKEEDTNMADSPSEEIENLFFPSNEFKAPVEDVHHQEPVSPVANGGFQKQEIIVDERWKISAKLDLLQVAQKDAALAHFFPAERHNLLELKARIADHTNSNTATMKYIAIFLSNHFQELPLDRETLIPPGSCKPKTPQLLAICNEILKDQFGETGFFNVTNTKKAILTRFVWLTGNLRKYHLVV